MIINDNNERRDVLVPTKSLGNSDDDNVHELDRVYAPKTPTKNISDKDYMMDEKK